MTTVDVIFDAVATAAIVFIIFMVLGKIHERRAKDDNALREKFWRKMCRELDLPSEIECYDWDTVHDILVERGPYGQRE